MNFWKRSTPRKAVTEAAAPVAGRPALMRALEQRIMFDASVAAVADASVQNNTHDAHADAAPVARPAGDSPAEAGFHIRQAVATPARDLQPARHEVVFVDANVRNYQSILADIGPQVEVVVLDARSDGFAQMADYLAGRGGIDAIHLISHGSQGAVQAGGTWLSADNLTAHADALARIGASLTSGGDLLLYGCDIGATPAGEDFARSLAAMTGADIAVSSDATGALARGGDWTLELHVGSVEAVNFSAEHYAGLLAAFTDTLASNPTGGGNVSTFNTTLGGASFTYTFTSQGNGGDITYDTAHGASGSASILLASAAFDTNTTERVTIARTDTTNFAFGSIYIDNAGGSTVTVGGYLNGVLVGSAQTVNMGATSMLNFGGIVVNEVRVTSTDFFNTNIDNFSGDTDVSPTLASATYNAATGAMVVTGTNLQALAGGANDIVANKFTFTGEGGATYTLTDTANVEIGSATSFTLNLSATDRAAVNLIANKNGTSSTTGTTFNIGATDDWNAAVTAGNTADLTGNGVTVSNVAVPTVTSATYNAATGALVVTGTGFLSRSGGANDIDVSKLTFTGEGGSTVTLTSGSVDITSGTSFSVTLNATDRAAIGMIANKNGTSSTSGTTYNLAAAEDWAAGADAAVVVADTTGNGVTVSNVAVPTVTSATYNAATGVLVVTGTGFLGRSGGSNDIDASKLTFTGEGGGTFTLTSSSVDITSGTSFSITLNGTDRAAIGLIVNKNGTSSTGGTTYNLAAAEDWAAGADAAVVVADTTGNGITASNTPVPAITSATYNAATGALVVTGTGFSQLAGSANDIVANKFTLTGEGGSTYTLTDTSDVEVSSGTSFTLALSATDRAGVGQIANKNGTSSTSGTTYNLAAAEDWAAGADSAVVVADLTGNGITVSNVPVPTIASATYNAATGVLVVTGTGFTHLSGAANDIDVGKLTLSGDSTAYTLTSGSVEITSGTSFSVTLNGTDQTALASRLNQNGTSSTGAVAYNLAAAEDWAAGADAAVVVADLTGNGVTVSGMTPAPTLGNLAGDSVAWAGVGNTVVLDAGANATVADTTFGALNGGNGDWSGGSLTVQRPGGALPADAFGFNTSGAAFTVSGGNLQSGGLTFATFTNAGGTLSISFTSSGTIATTALVRDVAQRITYRNDTPAGDAAVRFTLGNGGASTTADVTVQSDTIYVTNTTDTATIDLSNGVSFSEAVAIAAADATGTQTLVLAGSLAGQTVSTSAATSLGESLSVDLDSASGATLSGGTLSVGGGSTLTFSDGSGDTATIATTLSGAGHVAKAGAGSLTLSGGNAYNGTTGVSAGTLAVSSDGNLGAGTVTLGGGATLRVTGATTIDNAVALAGNATVQADANTTFSGTVGGNAVTLTKAGTGQLTLSGANTQTGSVAVAAGTLALSGGSAVANATAVSVASGATLSLGANETIGSLAGAGGVDVGTSTLTTGGDNTSTVFSGALSGSGGLVKAGSGTMTLSNTGNSGTFSGTTGVTGGTLSVAGDSNLGSGTVTVNAATLAITGAGTIDNTIALVGAAVIDNSAAVTLSGAVGGTGNLGKAGVGALTLSNGGNAYTGATTATAGTLLVTGALTGTSGITVASGATLGGTGSVFANSSTNTLNVSSGGTLSPGVAGAGTLTVNGNLAVASGGTLALDINGATAGTGYDQVVVNGTVNVSNASLSVNHTYTAGNGDTYTVIANDLADAVVGAFSGLPEGTTLTSGGNATTLTASYLGGSGNDFTLTAPIAPTVTAVSASSANGSYKIGDTIAITVTFSQNITVDTTGGMPTLLLETGAVDRTATYVSGSGTNTLTFSYTVQQGDTSADLDQQSTGALVSNGATLRDAGNHNANLALASPGAAGSLGANKALVVDGTRPTASVVVADSSLTVGETSLVTITFSEAVTGFSNANVTVDSGSLGTLSSANGGITWTATFTPTAGTTDLFNAIRVDKSNVQDLAGNFGTGTADSNNYAIDNVVPTVASLAPAAVAASSTTVTYTLTFSENVVGVDSSDIALVTTGGVTATLSNFTPVNAQTYQVQVTGIGGVGTIGVNLKASGTGIVDLAGNPIVGGLTGTTHTVDTTVAPPPPPAPPPPDTPAPSIASVNVPPSGRYNEGDVLTFVVNTSQTVLVNTTNGAPSLALDIGGTTRQAVYVSGSGGNALVFRYTVQAGDNDADGIALTGALQTNGATLRDPAGKDLLPALNGTGGTVGVLVDTRAPTATSLVAAPGSPPSAASVAYTLTLSEAVTGVDAADFSVVGTGGVTASVTGVTAVDARTYVVTVGNIAGNGSLQLRLDGSGAGIVDTAGNALSAPLTSEARSVETAAAPPPPAPTPSAPAPAPTPPAPPPVGGAVPPDILPPPAPPIAPPPVGASTPPAPSAPYAPDYPGAVPSPAPAPVVGGAATSLAPPPVLLTTGDIPQPTLTVDPPAAPALPGALAQVSPVAPLTIGNVLQNDSARTAGLAPRPLSEPALSAMPFIARLGGASQGITLQVSAPVGDVVAPPGQRIDIQLPDNAFVTNGPVEGISLSARLSDGRPLPSWLKFSAQTGRFEGTPPPGWNGTLAIKVTARDSQGREAATIFKLTVQARDGRAGLESAVSTWNALAPLPAAPLLRDASPSIDTVGRVPLASQLSQFGHAARQAQGQALLQHLRAASAADAAARPDGSG